MRSVLQTASATAPSTTVAGRVRSQARAIERTTVQRTWRQRRRPAADPDDGGGDHLGRRDGGAQVGAGEDHRRRRRLADEAVERSQVEDAPPDRADDAPASHGRPEGERGAAGDLRPQRHRERVQVSAWRAAAPRSRRSPSVRRSHRGRTRAPPTSATGRRGAARRPGAWRAASSRGASAREREAAGEADGGRDGQGDQHAEDADRPPAVEAAPVDRVDPRRRERRADQSADQGVPRARRQARPSR